MSPSGRIRVNHTCASPATTGLSVLCPAAAAGITQFRKANQLQFIMNSMHELNYNQEIFLSVPSSISEFI